MTCPHCGHVFQIKRDTFAIAGMNSILDQRLQDGTYFTHVCQHCFQPFYMTYPFLYRDGKKHFILILSNQNEFSNLPENEKVIICKNVTQFLFCFKVCSQQLNLTFVLHKQKQLEKKYNTKVEFEFYDEKNSCLWFTVNHEKIALVLKNYEIQNVYDRIISG
ncbi:CpXC domain-containing protein [Floccifex sp.]|uniref:CpXC domain-containing protein n=1 Tax=Floccifex sp. TaxID=2815810 RepID=UPI003F01B949